MIELLSLQSSFSMSFPHYITTHPHLSFCITHLTLIALVLTFSIIEWCYVMDLVLRT